MSFRVWLSVVTVLLLAVIIYLSRHEIVQAWGLLERVNIWILLLLIPGQILVYYAGGEMVFSYLRSKGVINHLRAYTLTRMALEMNFVNHLLPSGGVSGISYMTWRLKHYGASAGQATMAQVVRFAVGFMAFIVLLLVSVIAVTIDAGVNRWVITLSALLVGVITTGISLGIFLVSSPSRMDRFSLWSCRTINRIVRFLTFGRYRRLLNQKKVDTFFQELHRDYLALSKDKRILIKPFLWGFVFTLADAGLFFITFLALGESVNPAVILIAYGVAVLAGFVAFTPGGAGVYEVIMVAFLSIAGVEAKVAVAGILLTRVILLLGTIIFGYLFYQDAILHHGKTEASDL